MTDREMLALLEEAPEQGMEQLVSRYTGLVWSVAKLRLRETEDIKDCVNETFTEFYFHHGRFDPEKGTLKAYLAVIAQRLAAKRYRESLQDDSVDTQRNEAEDVFAKLESHDELERALAALEPVDEQIIRMKYYGGMTAKEIAACLELPYETVKKRHQRSLKKLRKALIIGLVVAALAALLAACAYVVLRWFGVVPGYAVNQHPENPVYILDKTSVSDGIPAITDCYWNDGRLVVDVRISNNEDSTDRGFPEGEVTGFNLIKPMAEIFIKTEETCRHIRYIFECGLPENAGDTLPLQLKLGEEPLGAVLREAEGELLLEDAGGYEWVEGKGGLFLLPRLENGELIVSVYTLNEGEYTIASGLTQGVFRGFGCPAAPVTVTAADGTVLTGQPVNYRPYARDTYLDWNFGPAEPGEYTFQVPYLYQTVNLDTQPEWEADLSAAPYDVDAVLEFTGGEVRLGRLEREENPEPSNTYNAVILIDQLNYENFSWYSLQAEWISHDPERTVVSVNLQTNHDQRFFLEAARGTVDGETVYTRTDTFLDAETGSGYYVFRDYLLGSLDPDFTVSGRLGSVVCCRWDHPFSISFTVKE